MTQECRTPTGSALLSQSHRKDRDFSSSSRRKRGLLVTGLLLCAVVYFLLPVGWLVLASTKSHSDLFSTFGFSLGTENRLWANLREVFDAESGVFGQWLGNSLLYSAVGAAGAAYFAAAAGYALAVYEFPGKKAVTALVMGGVLIPGTATALPLFLLFSRLGVADSVWSILLPSMVSPFGLFICKIYAESAISKEVIEAARLDGAGEIRIFHVLGLRILVPAIVTVLLFQLVGIWNNYFLPLIMLSDESKYPVTLGLNNWISRAVRIPEYFELTISGVFVSVIPLALVMILLQRFWRGGLTEGSIK